MAARLASIMALLMLVACHAEARSLKETRSARILAENVPVSEPSSLSSQTPQVPSVEKAEGPFSSAFHSVAAWLHSSSTWTGDGTAYSDAVNNTGTSFACSMRYINDKFSQHFAAINQVQWADGAACGRCIKARCIDPRCKVQNQDVLVQVVDLCPECKEGDVDFSFPAYRDVTGMWPHRLNIEWEWSSCAPEVNGTLIYDPKDGINQFWQAFYLSNARYPIAQVKLNGKVLGRSPFQFFIHGGMMPKGECELEITADSGATVKAKIPDLTKHHDLGVQFPLL